MLLDPDDIDWDEGNCDHATRHGVSVVEITQALLNQPTVRRNRKGRPGDYYVLGVTDGGRRIVRPITAWEQG